jgi:hypothetical protein
MRSARFDPAIPGNSVLRGWGNRRRRRPRRCYAVALLILGLAMACQPVNSRGTATSTAWLPPPPPSRYMTDSVRHEVETAGAGYNLLDVNANPAQVAELPSGTSALVWVGDYDNSTCAFQMSDAELRERIGALAQSGRVVGYYISDEAHASSCPTAPAQITGRSELIHVLAPGAFTYQVLDDPGEFRLFAHTSDVIGIDPYPCSYQNGCNFKKILEWATEARAAGITHLWGVVQVFQDSWYRYPTPDELVTILRQWFYAHVEGEQTFSWDWAGNSLSDQPKLLALLARFNRG